MFEYIMRGLMFGQSAEFSIDLVCAGPWRLGIFLFSYYLSYVNLVIFLSFIKRRFFFQVQRCWIQQILLYLFVCILWNVKREILNKRNTTKSFLFFSVWNKIICIFEGTIFLKYYWPIGNSYYEKVKHFRIITT